MEIFFIGMIFEIEPCKSIRILSFIINFAKNRESLKSLNMKKLLLFLLILTFPAGMIAQSFSLSDTNGVAIDPGSTFYVLGDPSDFTIVAHIYITNNAAEAKNVKAKKIINEGDTLPLTGNSFCWVLCWTEDIYVSPSSKTIQPGQTITEFTGDYTPNNIPGISTITYVFFDENNVNDSVAVVVEFNASPASVNEKLLSQIKLSGAYPNPVRDFLNIDYTMPDSFNKAAVVITNILGSRVMEVKLDSRSGKARIPVSELVNGIYFYSLVVDGSWIVTRKIAVKH